MMFLSFLMPGLITAGLLFWFAEVWYEEIDGGWD